MGLLQQFGLSPQQLVVGGIKKLFGGMGGPIQDKNSPAQVPLGTLTGSLGTPQGFLADAPLPQISPQDLAQYSQQNPSGGFQVQGPGPGAAQTPQTPQMGMEQILPMVQAVFPALNRLITSDYGPIKAPKKGASSFHQGIDIGGAEGSPIMSALSGVIQMIGKDNGYGNFLRMLADNGDELLYGHAKGFNVKPGQRVNAGDTLGGIGSTGISTGPHLHFEAKRKGKNINPHEYGI